MKKKILLSSLLFLIPLTSCVVTVNRDVSSNEENSDTSSSEIRQKDNGYINFNFLDSDDSIYNTFIDDNARGEFMNQTIANSQISFDKCSYEKINEATYSNTSVSEERMALGTIDSKYLELYSNAYIEENRQPYFTFSQKDGLVPLDIETFDSVSTVLKGKQVYVTSKKHDGISYRVDELNDENYFLSEARGHADLGNYFSETMTLFDMSKTSEVHYGMVSDTDYAIEFLTSVEENSTATINNEEIETTTRTVSQYAVVFRTIENKTHLLRSFYFEEISGSYYNNINYEAIVPLKIARFDLNLDYEEIKEYEGYEDYLASFPNIFANSLAFVVKPYTFTLDENGDYSDIVLTNEERYELKTIANKYRDDEYWTTENMPLQTTNLYQFFVSADLNYLENGSYSHSSSEKMMDISDIYAPVLNFEKVVVGEETYYKFKENINYAGVNVLLSLNYENKDFNAELLKFRY